jgi:glycosyltransferase involved in cell wall biosynthesis
LRVLQIVKGLDIGNLHGGAERFAADLAISLQRRGIEVLLCSFFGTDTAVEQQWKTLLSGQGIQCFTATQWMGHRNFGNYLSGLREVEKMMKGHPVDLCHSHFQLGTFSSIDLKIRGLTKAVVRTIHVTQEWEQGWYGKLGDDLFSQLLFPILVDSEVGVSSEITTHLASTLGARLFHRNPVCIHNAIPSSESNITGSDSGELPKPGEKVIAVIGRLSEEKGQRYLIEAVGKLRGMRDNFQLWVIGDGNLRGELEDLTQSFYLGDIVHFLGQRADVPALLRQIDLVVVPSLREGFPSVILESFAAGVPVIGTNVSGVKELIIPDESGWLVPPANANRLAETIHDAMLDEGKQEIIRQAGKRIAENFTIERVTDQYVELYRNLVKA